MPITKHLETIAVITPLGLRFWDPVLDEQVGESLVVTARPEDGGGPSVTAFRTASRVYAFQGLHGLQRVEYPAGELQTSSPPDQRSFVIEITDLQGRFVPLAFTVQLPLAERGLYMGSTPMSPPGRKAPGFYLFSAPTRALGSAFAVVRTELYDLGRAEPAAHALVEIEIKNRKWFGLSDARGKVAVWFPYPESNLTLGTSPPSGPPMAEQQWPLTLRFRYAPNRLSFPSGSKLPDLRSVRDQTSASIFTSLPTSSPPGVGAFELSTWLTFGQQLVLRTDALPQLRIASV